MAKLSDYGINVSELSNRREVTIRGQKFPIAFTMETMEYIAVIYDDDYEKFERDMNSMLQKKQGQISAFNLSASDLKIMRSLIFSMLKTGGLDEEPETIFAFLGMSHDLLEIYGTCMEIFSEQTFQVEDLKKSKTPQDLVPSKATQKKAKKLRKFRKK